MHTLTKLFVNKCNISGLIRCVSSLPKYETLTVTVPKKNVYHVELSRPDKLNTVNKPMWGDLKKCFTALHHEPECRVIILSGQGKLFTAGIDLKSLIEYFSVANEIEDIGRRGRFLYTYIKECQESISALEECTKPVMSVVHGPCIGAGIDLITAADMRYCTEDAWFQVKEVAVGLAADVGTLQRLPKVIGSASTARELCFTARKFYAKEALEIGLVSKVFPDKESAMSHVMATAEQIASMSPVAVQATKQNIIFSQNKSNAEGLEHVALINMVNHQSEDLAKSAIAMASKGEKPEFEDY
ncbi:unnamed protein product [Diatraea saccharalis]|uniref:Delta(3,5)-Delta(2,4)-dienoyl-CoA isomerase, mitochondrial n=1 Tax=Diatraea saccharalis TaxID=40085 RepID=A0A9P0G374_9NEOP|nr:unnamed protein product [Diatraea saccharalis]